MECKRDYISDMLFPAPNEFYSVELTGNRQSKRIFFSYFEVFKYINTTSVIDAFISVLKNKDECYWEVKRYWNDTLLSEFRLSLMGRLLDYSLNEESKPNSSFINTGDIINCGGNYGVYIGYDGIKEKHLCLTVNTASPDIFRDDAFDKEIRTKEFSIVSKSGNELLDNASYLIKQEPQYYLKWLLDWDGYKVKCPESAIKNMQIIISNDYKMYDNGKYWFG